MRRQKQYEDYARLLVRGGVNVQKGQMLVIRASVEDREFVRLCVQQAYQAGACQVQVDWHDDAVSRSAYACESEEEMARFPDWLVQKMEYEQGRGACYLMLSSGDPLAFDGLDAGKIAIAQKAAREKTAHLQAYTMNNIGQWSIGGLASAGWAKRVFPACGRKEAVDRLEEAIFRVSLVDGVKDPLEEWRKHDAVLIAHAARLTEYQFDSLHFQNSLGTDLTVGLVKDHVWIGGGDRTPAGVYFDPNIPTEECFCMPDKQRVEGTVAASRPLSYSGRMIEDFRFTFHQGAVKEFSAAKGQDALEELLEADEGSRYLGEVALVPYDSPVSRSGILFLNTLYDENAACHLALGAPYPENLKGGSRMSRQELTAHGANDSLQHEDFMFGTPDLSVDGILPDGTKIPVFRDGNFVF